MRNAPAAILLLASFVVSATFAQEIEQRWQRERSDDLEGLMRAEERADHEGRVRDYLRRHGDLGVIDPERMRALVRKEYERSRNAPRQPQPFAIGGTNWANVGPTNIAGRIRSIAPHPTTGGTVYVGSASGGIWKTTDAGATWTPLTESIANLTTAAIAIAASSPSTIYAGTGEGGIPGIGLIKSTDGGSIWTFPGSTVLSTLYFKVLVHPTNADDVLVGTSNGGHRSTNGGQIFTAWIVPMGTPSAVNDIVRDPANANTLYAAAYGGGVSTVLQSTDGGSNWTAFNSGLPSSGISSIALAIDSAGTTLYASFNQSGVAKVYKSVSGGTWANTGPVDPSYLYGGQPYYNNTIVVSPANSNTVIVCGTYCSKSTNGGTSWAALAMSGGSYHVDLHDLEYDATSPTRVLYFATDGGIYTSTDNGDTSTNRETGLVTSQFYRIAIDRSNPNRVFGGMQDNGTARRNSVTTTWDFMTSSDGQASLLTSHNPSLAWTSNQAYYRGNYLWRTKDGGGATVPPLFIQIAPVFPSTESLPFNAELVADSRTSSLLYTNTNRLWKSRSGGDAWFPLPTTTTDGSTWTTDMIDAIAIAPSDPQVIMVAKAMNVFRSTDGGNTWVRRITGLPTRYVNGIAIDPTDPTTAYVALATTYGDSLYYTSDGGASWTQRSSGLPSFAAQVVRIDPTDSATLYCGTDVGVYRSTDRGLNWSLFGTGVPKVSVYDLRISDDGALMRAGTYGRGVWDLQIPASTNQPPTAVISSPAASTVSKDSTIAFSGSIAEPDGQAVTGLWTFPDTWDSASISQAGSTAVSHTFNMPGIWPVSLSARDALGATASTSVAITVTEVGETCASPVTIPASGPFPLTLLLNTETYATSTDGTDPTLSCYFSSRPYYTAWFTFTPSSSGTYEISTCGSTFDTVLAAFTGSCGSLSMITGGCSDDADSFGTAGCPNGGSTITVSLTSGQTVRLMVGGHYYYTSRGLLALTVKLSGSTAPTVTRVAPSAGPSTGGSPVTLYGTNFASGMSAAFGGAAATNVSMLTSNIATAVTPSLAAGAVDVVVTNTDTQSGRLASGYTYVNCSISLSAGSVGMNSYSGGGSFAVTASAGCGWVAVSNALWIVTISAGIGNGTVDYTVSANTSTIARSGTITIGNQTFTVNQSGVVPVNLIATATSTSSISLAWSASSVDHFEVWRSTGAGFSLIASPTTTSYTDGGKTANTTYVYKVRAVDSAANASNYSNNDIATTIAFTDDPLVAGSTIIKAVHLTQLRDAVNAVRTAAGLGTVTWTNDPPTGVVVKLVHLTELRSALDAARSALSLPALSYTSATLGGVVKAVHFTELRNGVR